MPQPPRIVQTIGAELLKELLGGRSHGVSVGFVLVTLGLDALGVGIIAPIVPGLVQELAHLPTLPRRPQLVLA